MKMIVAIALALVAVAAAHPLENEYPKLIEEHYVQNEIGEYNFGFAVENGAKREEEGLVKEALNEDNEPQKVLVVRGSYTYINSEGKPETIKYEADETGYHATGPAVPTFP